MKNNSSTDRWIRLESKNLDQQFLNEIVHGLNRSSLTGSVKPYSLTKMDCSSVIRLSGHTF